MNPSTIEDDGAVMIHGHAISNIEAMALFAQYTEGDRESMDKEMLYAMIDILLSQVSKE